MKSFLICLFFIVTTITVNAQFGTAGQKVIGGSLSFISGKNTDFSYPDYISKNTGFSATLSAGKFTKKNVLSSFALSYGHSFLKQNTPGNIIKSNTNFMGASYSKTFFKEVAKKLFFGIGGSVGAGYNTGEINYRQNAERRKSEGFGINIGIAPILAYQVSNRFVINCSPTASFLSLNYSSSKTTYYRVNQNTTTDKSSFVYLNTGFFNSPLSNISLGFSYLLKQK